MEDILKSFGNRIRTLRAERKISQEELADRSGLHKNYIGMVERGERNPSLKNIYKFANALDINLSELFKI